MNRTLVKKERDRLRTTFKIRTNYGCTHSLVTHAAEDVISPQFSFQCCCKCSLVVHKAALYHRAGA